MGQWGKVKRIGAMVFMPKVKTEVFNPIQCDDKIEDIFLMQDGRDKTLAEQTLKDLKDEYVGQFYNMW